MKLDPWQEEIIDYEGHILLGKGRRIGATHVFGLKAVEHLVKNHNPHPKSQIVCVSLTEDQAQLIIAFATNYAKKKYPQYIGKGRDKPGLNRLILKVNGNRRILIARPVGASGDSIRGYEGQVLMIDEASRMPKPFWAAAKPILATTGGKIWAWSTFHGTKEYFYKKFDESWIQKSEKSRFKSWCVNTEDVFENRELSDIWTKEVREEALNFLEEERKDMSVLEYNQEYMAIASQDLRQFFSDEWIDKVCVMGRGDRIPGHDYFMGNDLAGMGGDKITYEIFDGTDENNKIQMESIIKTKQRTTQTTENIINLNKIWDFNTIGLDDGGPGVGIYDQLLIEEDTRNKVIALNNSSRWIDAKKEKSKKLLKEDMYFYTLGEGERGRLKLLDDEAVRTSLRSIQYEYIDDKRGKRTLRIFGSDAHVSEGVVRGVWVIKNKNLNIWVSFQ